MKTIRFTQIADSRVSENRHDLETRIDRIRTALAAIGAELHTSRMRELQFPPDADGLAIQWRCDCTASSASATKKAMMRAVNSIKAVYYS